MFDGTFSVIINCPSKTNKINGKTKPDKFCSSHATKQQS